MTNEIYLKAFQLTLEEDDWRNILPVALAFCFDLEEAWNSFTDNFIRQH